MVIETQKYISDVFDNLKALEENLDIQLCQDLFFIPI
jgi:hypothetical protein